MTEVEDWSMDKCIDWLKDPYNQPDCETDDSFDRAFRSSVKQRLNKLTENLKKVFIAIRFMHIYQEKNNVKNDCLTNTIVLYDICRALSLDVKAVNKVVAFEKSEILCVGHILVNVEGKDFECSYDMSEDYRGEEPIYLNELPKEINDKDKCYEKFKEFAKDINNGKFLIANKTNYDNQMELLAKVLKFQLIKKK